MPLATPRSTVPQSVRTAVVGLSAALFVVALFLPALEFHGVNGAYVNGHFDQRTLPGFDPTLDLWHGSAALFNGLVGALDGDFAGYANPCLWLAWIFLLADRIRPAAIFSAVAAALSLLTFQLFHSPIPEDEGVVKRALLTHLHSGAWVWFASIAITLLACLLWWKRQLPRVPPPPPAHAAPPPAPGAHLRY